MPSFDNLDSEDGVAALNTYLADHSYVNGWVASGDDFTSHAKVSGAPNAGKFPHASRWYKHISSFTEEERAQLASAAPAAKAEKKAEAEDDFELFGDDDEEEKKLQEQRKKEAEEKKKKSDKPTPTARSMIVLDVKPWDDTTDMVALEQAGRHSP